VVVGAEAAAGDRETKQRESRVREGHRREREREYSERGKGKNRAGPRGSRNFNDTPLFYRRVSQTRHNFVACLTDMSQFCGVSD
jgi:hypothetical protein